MLIHVVMLSPISGSDLCVKCKAKPHVSVSQPGVGVGCAHALGCLAWRCPQLLNWLLTTTLTSGLDAFDAFVSLLTLLQMVRRWLCVFGGACLSENISKWNIICVVYGPFDWYSVRMEAMTLPETEWRSFVAPSDRHHRSRLRRANDHYDHHQRPMASASCVTTTRTINRYMTDMT